MKGIPEKKLRLEWVDITKFWGILAIVWGHTLSSGDVHRYLYSFHIPLFFYTVGLVFTGSELSFWHFTAKKAKALLIPYFTFAIISILIFSVFGSLAGAELNVDVSGYSLPANLLEMLTGQCRANSPLWFLPCIFCCYIFCYILSRIVENWHVYPKRVAALAVASVSLALCCFNERFFKMNALVFKVDVAVFMLAFVSAAYLLKPLLQKRMKPVIAVVLSALLLAAGGIMAFANSTVKYLSNHYGNVFLFFTGAGLTVTGLCILSILISQANMKKISALLAYIGKRTLPILLMHKFPILFFRVIVPWTKQPMKENDPVVGLVVAIVSIAACLGVDVFLARIMDMMGIKVKTAYPG